MNAALLAEPNARFQVLKVPRPSPGRDQVLVKVAAAALNPLDAKIRAGLAPHAQQPLPAVLGIDVAGTVEAVGEGVSAFRVGDEVMGMAGGVGGRQGALAQYLAVEAALLAPKPRAAAMRDAATVPLAFVTAWEGLVERAGLRSGQTVLIQAGAGGVGLVCVQLAIALGARVFATGRKAHRSVIEATGATFVDSESPGASSGALEEGFDVVYDTLGGEFLDRSFDAVKPYGHVVSCLGWGSHSLAALSFKRATYSGVFTLEPLLSGNNLARLGEILVRASRLMEEGALVPRVASDAFGLESVNEAFDLLASRRGSGRVVVEVA
jgi:NADPH:quinone reductase-like Zn-dependent oxidoreductase